MKLNKKKIHLFEYKTIFPASLVVACNENLQEVLDYFVDAGDGSPIEDDGDWDNNMAYTYHNIERKSDRKNVILVIFNGIDTMTFKTIVHEATHVMLRMFENAGEKIPGIETLAYLLEWIAGCINDTRILLNEISDKIDGRKK